MTASFDTDFSAIPVEEVEEFSRTFDTEKIPDDPETSVIDSDDYDEPDPKFVKGRKRPRGAVTYEGKVNSVLNSAVRFAVTNPATVPDAAAILQYGPGFSEKLGELAATDPKVARAIDWLTEGTENTYLAFATAALPLVMQIVRNHEPVLEPKTRGIPYGRKDPKTGQRKTFRLKFGVKLGRLRAVTVDPKLLESNVFDNEHMIIALEKQGITVNRGRR